MEQRAEQEAEKPELGSQQLWLHMAETLRSSCTPGEETYNRASMGPQHCSWLGTSSPTPVQCLGPWGKYQGLACPHTHAAQRRGHGRSRRCRAWLAPAELSALLHKSRAGQPPSSSRDRDSTDSWWNWHNPQTETVPETLIAVAGEVGVGAPVCTGEAVPLAGSGWASRGAASGIPVLVLPLRPVASSHQQGRASSDAHRGWTGSASSSVRPERRQGLNTEQAAPARGPSVANLPPPALQQYSSQPVPVVRCYSSVRLLLFNYFISFLFFCLVISIEGEIKCSRW